MKTSLFSCNIQKQRQKRFSIPLVITVFLLLPGAIARAETITVGGTGIAIGLLRQLAANFTKTHPEIHINIPDSVGSGGGIKAVLTGRFDFSFSARPIKPKNQDKGLSQTPYLKTPFVLAVSPIADAAPSFSKPQILATLSGESTHWSNGTRIKHVLRNAHETGTLILIENFKGIEPLLNENRNKRGALVALSDQEAMDIAEHVPGAIVPTTLLAIRTENRNLIPITIGGIHPSLANLESGHWKMAINLYIIKSDTLSPAAQMFFEYLFSDESAATLHKLGGLALNK